MHHEYATDWSYVLNALFFGFMAGLTFAHYLFQRQGLIPPTPPSSNSTQM
jgi:hypothetical protein